MLLSGRARLWAADRMGRFAEAAKGRSGKGPGGSLAVYGDVRASCRDEKF